MMYVSQISAVNLKCIQCYSNYILIKLEEKNIPKQEGNGKKLTKEYEHKNGWGPPWWSSGKKSTCQCREHGFNPWSGKIPHTLGQLNPCTRTTEAHTPGAHALQQEKPLQ